MKHRFTIAPLAQILEENNNELLGMGSDNGHEFDVRIRLVNDDVVVERGKHGEFHPWTAIKERHMEGIEHVDDSSFVLVYSVPATDRETYSDIAMSGLPIPSTRIIPTWHPAKLKISLNNKEAHQKLLWLLEIK